MKRNRLVKRRNLNFQTLDARLAFDADSVVSDLQIEETRPVDFETVDLSVADGDVNNLGMIAFFSVNPSDLAQDGELQEADLQSLELQRSDNLQTEDVDAPIMVSFGSTQVDFDTNNDGELAAADALLIINALNARNLNAVAPMAGDASEASKFEMNVEFDINRDGMLSPIDALLVINALNLQSNAAAARLVGDESAAFAATLPTDVPGELTGVEDSIAAEVEDKTEISPFLCALRYYGATEVKVDGVSNYSTIALSFDAEGKVVANAGDTAVEVTVDENNVLSIAGKEVPIGIASLGETQQFAPYAIEDESVIVTWPWSSDVDNAFANM